MIRNSPKYNVGIVGCGTISRVHAQAILANERAELVAACSRSEEKRSAFCNEFGITGYASYEEFLKSDLDVVVLCTPNGTHLDYGLLAANAGKHLIIEKPLEVSVARGKQLADHCKTRGVSLAVIFQNRFMNSARQMKKAIDDGVIGKPVMARASVKWFRDQHYYTSAPWRGSLKLDGGGALINQAIHTVDLLLWLMGPMTLIQAFRGTLTHGGIEGEDNLVASIQFANGALGVFEASTSIIPAQNRRIEINGTTGTAVLEGDTFEIIRLDASASPQTPASSAGADSPLSGLTFRPHAEQYAHIFQNMDKGETPPVSGLESLNALAFVEAAYRSAETHTPVSPQDLHSFTSTPDGKA
jgi:UDP-N-acetyl-2-amino-2-deoxyglucuronate dehydrogenase